jgi:outer membrane receptor protein involved in Fe transport
VPVDVVIRNAYYGAYLSDTLNLTPKFSVTGSGRFNIANIALNSQLPADPNAPGAGLSGRHYYQHFNPALAAAYAVSPFLVLYGGFTEANAAPTPAELSCASPQDSCSLANFMSGDPNLQQIITRTLQAGIRGTLAGPDASLISYTADGYVSNTNDDIEFQQSPFNPIGEGYFSNVGTVRRAGMDAGLKLDAHNWSLYAAYSLIEATYQSRFIESTNNPQADADGNITIEPGDHLPAIPQHIFKFGGDVDATPRWKIGVSVVAQTCSFLYGDEANLTPPLGGYAVLDFMTSYQLTPRLQLFGGIDNVTDTKYYSYGTFSPTGLDGGVYVAQAPSYSNPRSYSLAAPIGGYAGVKFTF